MAKDTNTTKPGAHPGAAKENMLSTPEGEPEYSLFTREVSADGMVRLHAGPSEGINLGMGYVDDGREKQPVSMAAPTVSEEREVFLTDAEQGAGEVDEKAARATALTTPDAGTAADSGNA